MGKPWEKYGNALPAPAPVAAPKPWDKYNQGGNVAQDQVTSASTGAAASVAGRAASLFTPKAADPLAPAGGFTPEQQAAQKSATEAEQGASYRQPAPQPEQPKGVQDQIASWISDNLTPAAEYAGEFVAGQRENTDMVRNIPGAVTEWGATTVRDPVEGANQAVDTLEPTHVLARGYNNLRDALASAFEGDWQNAQENYTEATPDLLFGTAGILPGGSATTKALLNNGERAAASSPKQLFKPGPTATDRAADILIKKMKADGLTIDDLRTVQASLARRGDSGVYETLSEVAGLSEKSSGANLRGLAMALGAVPGPAQEALMARVAQNADQLPKRTSRAASRATGQDASKFAETLTALEQRLKTESGPIYEKFYNSPVDPAVYDRQIAPVLNAPHGREAMERAARGLGVEAASLQARVASGDAASMARLQRTYDAAKALKSSLDGKSKASLPPLALDHVKRAFDDLIEREGHSYSAKNLRAAKNSFAESVSNATGQTYGDALGFYSEGKRLEEAFDIGLGALNMKTHELERLMQGGSKGSKFSGGEIEAIAMGVARNIDDMIEANDQRALTTLLKGKALKNLSTALGDPKAAAKFEQSIERLAANREWGRRVGGGSDTAMRQAAVDDATKLEEDPLTRAFDRAQRADAPLRMPGSLGELANLVFWHMPGVGAKSLAKYGADAYRRVRYPGIRDEAVNEALAPIMASPLTDKPLENLTKLLEARAKPVKGQPQLPAPTGAAPALTGPKGKKADPTQLNSPGFVTGAVVGGGATYAANPDDPGLALYGALGGALVGRLLEKSAGPTFKWMSKPNQKSVLTDEVRASIKVNDGMRAQGRIMEASEQEINDFVESIIDAREGGYNDEAIHNYLKQKYHPDIAEEVAARVDGEMSRGPKPAQSGSKQPLPMDEASRLGRAREQGFDTDTVWYHGDPSRKLDALEASGDEAVYGPGVYLTDTVGEARKYKLKDRQQRYDSPVSPFPLTPEMLTKGVTGKVYQTHVRGKGVNQLDYERRVADRIDQLLTAEVGERTAASIRNGDRIAYSTAQKTFKREAEQQVLDELKSEGVTHALIRLKNGKTHARVFDPKDIRQTDAKFDPAESGSSKLLNGVSFKGVSDKIVDAYANIKRALLSNDPRQLNEAAEALKSMSPSSRALVEHNARREIPQSVMQATQGAPELSELAGRMASRNPGGADKPIDSAVKRFQTDLADDIFAGQRSEPDLINADKAAGPVGALERDVSTLDRKMQNDAWFPAREAERDGALAELMAEGQRPSGGIPERAGALDDLRTGLTRGAERPPLNIAPRDENRITDLLFNPEGAREAADMMQRPVKPWVGDIERKAIEIGVPAAGAASAIGTGMSLRQSQPGALADLEEEAPTQQPDYTVSDRLMPPNNPAEPPPELNFHIQETFVRAQQRLIALGYLAGGGVQADGRDGPMTRDAVAEFQSTNGLPETGELDPATLRALWGGKNYQSMPTMRTYGEELAPDPR